MEVLLAGNTGYVTETFIEESFPAEEAEPSFGLRQFFKTGGRDAVSAIGLDMSVPFLYVDNTGKKPSYEINRDEIRFIKQYRKLEK